MDNNAQHRPSGYVDSLRMSAREHAEILNELDARQSRHADSNRRTEERLRFSQQALLFVQLKHPGGTDGNYLVRTRNLSRTGIGFFHGAFVYNNTPCTVALRSTDRAVVTIPGRVVRCNHVRGHIHEIGVHFDKPIRLRQFLGTQAPADEQDATSTELPRLDGRILCVDDSVPDQDLLKFHLEHLGLRCDIAPSPDAALDLADSVRFDLVITTLALPGMSGFDLAASLRAAGQRCPIIAMTPDERDATRADALRRGFANFLVKPYHFEDLLRILLNHLTPAPSGSGELLPSDLWSDVAMRPLIRRFLQRLGPQSQEIRRLASAPHAASSIAAGNPDPVFRKLCTELKGSAGSYGYPSISLAAHDLLDPASPYDLPGRLDTLVRLCSSATRLLELEAATEPAAPAA
jgi:DNA-binding response OmpR family regulator